MRVEPLAVAVSPDGWLMTYYGWLAGQPWFLRRRRKLAAYGGLRKVYINNQAYLFILEMPLALFISNILCVCWSVLQCGLHVYRIAEEMQAMLYMRAYGASNSDVIDAVT